MTIQNSILRTDISSTKPFIYLVGPLQLEEIGVTAIQGICVDRKGVIYASAPKEHVIIKISNGHIEVYAGVLGIAGNDGYTSPLLTECKFDTPLGLAVDRSGSLYICDSGNNQIRMIRGNRVYTLAGSENGQSGFSNVFPGLFNNPVDVTINASNRLFVVDKSNHSVRMIPVGERTIKTVAGTGVAGDVIGANGVSQLNSPESVTADAAGNIYIADAGNYKLKKMNQDFVTRNFSGTGVKGGTTGIPSICKFYDLKFIECDARGFLYVVDFDEGSGSRIVKIDPNGRSFAYKNFDSAIKNYYSFAINQSNIAYVSESVHLEDAYSSSSSSYYENYSSSSSSYSSSSSTSSSSGSSFSSIEFSSSSSTSSVSSFSSSSSSFSSKSSGSSSSGSSSSSSRSSLSSASSISSNSSSNSSDSSKSNSSKSSDSTNSSSNSSSTSGSSSTSISVSDDPSSNSSSSTSIDSSSSSLSSVSSNSSSLSSVSSASSVSSLSSASSNSSSSSSGSSLSSESSASSLSSQSAILAPRIILENGDMLITEGGDNIILE